MKYLSQILVLVFILGLSSCRDTKKVEDAEIMEEESIDSIIQAEDVSEEINEVSKELDKEVNELEDALKELDTI